MGVFRWVFWVFLGGFFIANPGIRRCPRHTTTTPPYSRRRQPTPPAVRGSKPRAVAVNSNSSSPRPTGASNSSTTPWSSLDTVLRYPYGSYCAPIFDYLTLGQCCGSMTFWRGSGSGVGSADPEKQY